MPKKLAISYWLLVISLLFSVLSAPAFAQTSPSPVPTGKPTCDLCGWCNQATDPKPPSWDQCISCLYKPDGSPQERAYYTVLGCFSTDPSGAPFVKSILSIVFGMAGGIAFLAVLWGSAMVLTSAGDPLRLQGGKDIIVSSIFGILLIIFSVFLLRVVGYEILRIPGFGG